MTGREQVHLTADGRERLQLRGHQELTIGIEAGVERNDAHWIPCNDGRIRLCIVQDERKNPVQPGNTHGAFGGQERDDDFAIRLRPEGIIREFPAQCHVIVDLAIDGQHVAAVRAHEGLGTVGHIHDGQPFVGENGTVIGKNA
jgi:hypothetical protein